MGRVLCGRPDRVLSATPVGTGALSEAPLVHADGTRTGVRDLPGAAPGIPAEWARPVEDRGLGAELDRRVRHRSLLNGDTIPFDPRYPRELERRVIAHAGRYDTSGAHARAERTGRERTGALAGTEVPVLVIAAPAAPAPSGSGGGRRLGARGDPGHGARLPREVLTPLAEAILVHTAASQPRSSALRRPSR
ncbi:hypothetical protein [Streptomyces sp. NPDC006368]|uniref:hypothetical protein n=1 Tax=Streptomyces sp. NPDC006368 TaxID=3156760 RepID=UPI0033BB438B